jgi:hypothetical protein
LYQAAEATKDSVILANKLHFLIKLDNLKSFTAAAYHPTAGIILVRTITHNS